MATECVNETFPETVDVTVKIIKKPGGRRFRVVVEYDNEVVDGVLISPRQSGDSSGANGVAVQ